MEEVDVGDGHVLADSRKHMTRTCRSEALTQETKMHAPYMPENTTNIKRLI